MIPKLLTFSGRTERGIFNFVVDGNSSFLEKTAAEYHPTIASYIRSAKVIPGKTQILLTALGAFEWWGNNANGDAFPEDALAHEGSDYGYKTFESHAKVYKHHINKNPAASYGDVALSVYNPRYHRVELIVVVDNAKAPDIAERVSNGEEVSWSMGCQVPFDICSICGNKAPTAKDYCEHLKYYMGRIFPPSGKVAYAINTKPKFHDISMVLIGADRIAKTLMKVAFQQGQEAVVGSAELAEKMGRMEKEIPAEPPASLDTLARSIPEVKAMEPALPRETLDSLATRPLPSVFSTLAMMGILPKPQEFQRIILVHIGKRDLADQLDSKNCCFDPMSVEEPAESHTKILNLDSTLFDPQIMQTLLPFMPDRSYAAPHLGRRLVVLCKSAHEEPLPNLLKFAKEEEEKERKPLGIVPLLMLAAGLYAAFGKSAPKAVAGKLDSVIVKHPGLAAALGLGALGTFNSMFGAGSKGQYTESQSPEAGDIFARIEEQKQKPYLKMASLMGPFSKRLFLGVPLAYMASGVLQKHKELNPYEQEGRMKSFIRRNPDIVSGALIADALLSTKGKGTHGLITKMKSITPGAPKIASAQEFLSNSLIWPVAIGKANLPGRVVGGLFDQAALETSRRLLENRKKKSGPLKG